MVQWKEPVAPSKGSILWHKKLTPCIKSISHQKENLLSIETVGLLVALRTGWRPAEKTGQWQARALFTLTENISGTQPGWIGKVMIGNKNPNTPLNLHLMNHEFQIKPNCWLHLINWEWKTFEQYLIKQLSLDSCKNEIEQTYKVFRDAPLILWVLDLW